MPYLNVEPCLCTSKNLNNHAKWWLMMIRSTSRNNLASRIVEFLVSIDPGDACARHLFSSLTLNPTAPSATQSAFLPPLDIDLYWQSVSWSASAFFISGEEHQWTETPVHSSLLPREVSLVLGERTPLSVKRNLWKAQLQMINHKASP